MLNEEVRRVMQKVTDVVDPDAKISEVAEKMMSNRIMQLPVVDQNNKFLGLITVYDLWKHSKVIDEDSQLRVRDVMNTNVIKITPKDKIGTAAELFMDKRFKMLPVVNLRNELKGVITTFDVIKTTLKKEYPRPILYEEIINS
jgi:CBS domain-containing protein